jgi:uncharacterized repeat protein (TIGR01451 family)
MQYRQLLSFLIASLIISSTRAQILQSSMVVDSFKNEILPSNEPEKVIYKKADNNDIILVRNFHLTADNIKINSGHLYDSVCISIYSAQGVKKWEKRLGDDEPFRINDAAIHENSLIMIGDKQSSSIFVRVDIAGNIVSYQEYPDVEATAKQSLQSITPDHKGNYLISSIRWNFTDYGYCFLYFSNFYVSASYYLIKTNADGNVIWQREISQKNYFPGTTSFFQPVPPDNVFTEADTVNKNILYLDFFKTQLELPIQVRLLQIDTNIGIISNTKLGTDIDNASCSTSKFKIIPTTSAYNILIEDQVNVTPNASSVIQYIYSREGNLIDTIRRWDIGANSVLDYSAMTLMTHNHRNYISSKLTNNNYYKYFQLGMSNSFNNNFILMCYDEKLNKVWGNIFQDESIRDFNKKDIFQIDDSTLLLCKHTYQTSLSDSIAYLKFYTISTGNNKLLYDVYIDKNNNNIHDSGDSTITDITIELNDGTISTQFLPQTKNMFVESGTYTSRLVNYEQKLKQFDISPDIHTSTFSTSFGQTDTVRFRLTQKPDFRDLQVSIIPTTAARPGFEAHYKIITQNTGFETIRNITLKLKADSLQTYTASDSPAPTVSQDTLTWEIDSMTTYEKREFSVYFNNATPPTLNQDDTLHLYAAIYPVENDSFPADNQFWLHQPVVNSYDPNDKQETNGGSISTAALNARNYLYYTIRFQNTGTASAVKVVVKDTLAATLDWSSFEMLSSSHSYQLGVSEKRHITWEFPNIYLADSTSDERNSHGYIHFRIKPASGLTQNDVISNRAAIYFDFNPPIFTNTHTTQIVQPRLTALAVAAVKTIHVYPNPTQQRLTLEATVLQAGNYTLRISDVKGQVVQQQNVEWHIGNQQVQVELPYSAGIYILHITDTQQNTVYNAKIIKQ